MEAMIWPYFATAPATVAGKVEGTRIMRYEKRRSKKDVLICSEQVVPERAKIIVRSTGSVPAGFASVVLSYGPSSTIVFVGRYQYVG